MADAQFRADVLAAFAASEPAIPSRWFYDDRGSQLFERITELADYYPTRVERGILEAHAADLRALIGDASTVVELGSGSSAKTPLVLTAVRPVRYVAIDISGEMLREATRALATAFPAIDVRGVEADFTQPFTLDVERPAKLVGFFPGSTIGNWTPARAAELLRSLRASFGDDSTLIIGIDRKKDRDTLVRAYDDRDGITARFNLNLFERINRELDGTLPIDQFKHVALWNARHGRIEMHLEALADVRFAVSGTQFALRAGQRVHTEYSYKYEPLEADLLLRIAGWLPIAMWSDAANLFSVIVARAAAL